MLEVEVEVEVETLPIQTKIENASQIQLKLFEKMSSKNKKSSTIWNHHGRKKQMILNDRGKKLKIICGTKLQI